MQKRMLLFLNTLLIIFYNIACLSHNQHRGVLRVGTTGDYPPITDYNPHTGQFNGAAIEQAKKLASYLGLQVKFVRTTWPTLSADLRNDKFDIAMGGISETKQRKQAFLLTLPVGISSKVPLIRCVDCNKYNTLYKINQPTARIIENVGGTNMQFVTQYLPHATLMLITNNKKIFKYLLDHKADVMITDSTEAKYRASITPGLCVVHLAHPMMHEFKVYMVSKSNKALLNKVNKWIKSQKILEQENEKI